MRFTNGRIYFTYLQFHNNLWCRAQHTILHYSTVVTTQLAFAALVV